MMTETNIQTASLSAIKIGVIDEKGRVQATITFEEFLRLAKSQPIFFHTNAPPGAINFDLTISNTDNIIGKVDEWRKQQQKRVEVTGIMVG
jgi:hypothetical protein